MPIEYQPFETFRSTVQQLVVPEDLAEQMEGPFRDYVGAALSDIQTLIEGFRSFNFQFFAKDNVDEFCAASIFQGPVGKVTQLFAYKPGKDCKKLYYQRVSLAELDCWIERQRCVLCNATTPPSHHIYDSPYCNYWLPGDEACGPPYLLTEPEDDCKFRGLDDDDRIFAVGPDYKIYAAPRFPCGYNLLLQWQGINRKWNGVDLVPVDQQLREAVMNYVENRIARKEKDHVSAERYFSDYTINLRTLRYRYQDEHDTQAKRDCSAGIEQLMADATPLYPTAIYGPAALPSPPPVVCPECPDVPNVTGPLNQAIYDSGRDLIFALRGGYLYKINATTGIQIASVRITYPDYDDTYLCLDPVTDHIFATSWMTFADQNENTVGSRFVKKLVKINPDTLAVASTTVLPNGTFSDLNLFESGPRQVFAINNLIYGLYFSAAALTDGIMWTFDPVGLTWNTSGSFNTNGTYYKSFTFDTDLSLFWVADVFGATSYDLSLNAGPTLNFAGGKIGRGICYRSTGNKLYFTMTKQGTTTPQFVAVIKTDGTGEALIDTGRANALPFNIRYRASNDRIYVPTWGDDTVVIIDPTTDTVESVKTGFDSPFDVVFAGSRAFAVQHGPVGLKEIV